VPGVTRPPDLGQAPSLLRVSAKKIESGTRIGRAEMRCFHSAERRGRSASRDCLKSAPHREVFHSPGRIAGCVRGDAFEHIAFRCILPCGCHPAGFKDDGGVARAVTGIGSTSRSLARALPPLRRHEPSRIDVRAFARRMEDHHPSTLNHIARASFEQGCRLLSKRSDGGMIRVVLGVWDRFFRPFFAHLAPSFRSREARAGT
jgi:hypothetical protein